LTSQFIVGAWGLTKRDSSRNRGASQPWADLRLRDRIAPGVRVLFVGINPGVRSALTGHHFAGYSNRFWKLLYDSGLLPEPIASTDDGRLPEWELGITNLVPRPSPGIGDLRPAEYHAGVAALARKVRRFRPAILALVGITLYRMLFPREREGGRAGAVAPGPRPETFHGARVFVLPNPSGRNANFTYAEMLAAFKALKRLLDNGS
jgi:TDG/mug DNA glycosylase family protein